MGHASPSYTIRYRLGNENAAGISSLWSSQRTPQENPGEQHIHYITNEAVPVSIKLLEIITESTKDEKINEAIKSLETNQWNKLLPFYVNRDELTISKNIFLKIELLNHIKNTYTKSN